MHERDDKSSRSSRRRLLAETCGASVGLVVIVGLLRVLLVSTGLAEGDVSEAVADAIGATALLLGVWAVILVAVGILWVRDQRRHEGGPRREQSGSRTER